jgi:hypothetical protein
MTGQASSDTIRRTRNRALDDKGYRYVRGTWVFDPADTIGDLFCEAGGLSKLSRDNADARSAALGKLLSTLASQLFVPRDNSASVDRVRLQDQRSALAEDEQCHTPSQIKIQRRDEMLKRAAQLLHCDGSPAAIAKLAASYREFRNSTWPSVRQDPVCPEQFVGRIETFFFLAMQSWPAALTPTQLAAAIK